MKPIINPVFFYIADTAPCIKFASLVVAAIGIIITLIILLTIDLDESTKKAFKTLKVISIVSVLLFIFVPSQETIYKMGIASLVTEDNVSYVANLVNESANEMTTGMKDGTSEFIEDIIGYVVNAVNEIRKGD